MCVINGCIKYHRFQLRRLFMLWCFIYVCLRSILIHTDSLWPLQSLELPNLCSLIHTVNHTHHVCLEIRVFSFHKPLLFRFSVITISFHIFVSQNGSAASWGSILITMYSGEQRRWDTVHWTYGTQMPLSAVYEHELCVCVFRSRIMPPDRYSLLDIPYRFSPGDPPLAKCG